MVAHHRRFRSLPFTARLLCTLTTWLLCAASSLAWQSSFHLSSSSRQSSPPAVHRLDAALNHQELNAASSSLTIVPSEHCDGLRNTRRGFLASAATRTGACVVGLGGIMTTMSDPANALVKGNAPPPKNKAGSDRPKCTNLDECQAMAEIRSEEERAAALVDAVPTSVTKAGTRYRDLEPGEGDNVAKKGDEVEVYYKVLKLGKRSYDGLSGEGTVVFSRGYGLEDDEKAPGSTSFKTVLGAYGNIAALNDGLIGMKERGVRRIVVLPQSGWRKPGGACDGGPGGSGNGGDLKTDFVVVPTATMVAEEACFDSNKLPFPASYAQQRRMAQRFDQSLIMEVTLVSTKPSTDGF